MNAYQRTPSLSSRFLTLGKISLLALPLLTGCNTVYVSDAEIMPAQPLLSDAQCQCDFGSLSVERPAQELQAVYFDTGKSTLRPEAQRKLDAIANAIRFNNPTSVVIEGNADNRGNVAYNRSLGQRRAKRVRQGLIQRGIAADLLKLQTYGEKRPVAPNTSTQGRQLNRRVDVTLYLR